MLFYCQRVVGTFRCQMTMSSGGGVDNSDYINVKKVDAGIADNENQSRRAVNKQERLCVCEVSF